MAEPGALGSQSVLPAPSARRPLPRLRALQEPSVGSAFSPGPWGTHCSLHCHQCVTKMQHSPLFSATEGLSGRPRAWVPVVGAEGEQ